MFIYLYKQHKKIIYVGITNNINRRNIEHEYKSYWHDKHTQLIYANHENSILIKRIESYLIHTLKPEFNKQYGKYTNCKLEYDLLNFIIHHETKGHETNMLEPKGIYDKLDIRFKFTSHYIFDMFVDKNKNYSNEIQYLTDIISDVIIINKINEFHNDFDFNLQLIQFNTKLQLEFKKESITLFNVKIPNENFDWLAGKYEANTRIDNKKYILDILSYIIKHNN